MQLILPAAVAYNIFKVKYNQEQIIVRENTKLSHITISRQNFTHYNLQGKKEITWNGIMYDVKDVVERKENYVLDVLADDCETALQHVNSKLIKTEDDGKAAASGYFFSFLYFEKNNSDDVVFSHKESAYSHLFIVPVIVTPYLRILKPPPDIV